jgi:hypothetical protein
LGEFVSPGASVTNHHDCNADDPQAPIFRASAEA